MLAEFGTGQVFWSFLWFFIFIIWIYLLIFIFSDIFRSRDLSGWGKALWSIFVILVPWLGVLVYLIARGKSMSERDRQQAQARQDEFQAYVKDVATTSTGSADELTKLASLRDQGVLTDAEFAQQKAKILA
jgi:Short C-terminal domain/Phospholipase_D-nuclease N-terminal